VVMPRSERPKPAERRAKVRRYVQAGPSEWVGRRPIPRPSILPGAEPFISSGRDAAHGRFGRAGGTDAILGQIDQMCPWRSIRPGSSI
jgi:hypothetical protein